MEDKNGQIESTHSISAGLDYPGVGPEHSWLKDNKRVKYVTVTDKEALEAFYYLTEKEGIIPALETAHALAYTFKIAKSKSKNFSLTPAQKAVNKERALAAKSKKKNQNKRNRGIGLNKR